MPENQTTDKIRLGVSTCLLGENVRYDGGHKRDRFITDVLSRYVDFVPVCPEVECGFPIPRESFRLVGDSSNPRLVTTKTKVDHTDRMKAWAEKRVRELESENLCGYIFKSKSPSSGLLRVKVYDKNGVPSKSGVGLFARAFTEHFPLLPVEEEGRLNDLPIRENFIERIFTLKRWREMLEGGRKRGSLVEFHTRHKLLLLAHSPEHYRQMGKLVARPDALSPTELFDTYQALLMQAMERKATVKKHINVIQHMLGYFKKELTSDEKQEMLEILEHYRNGDYPLIVPLTLLNHYVRKYDPPYLRKQYYLNPHPLELQLRNHA